MQERFENDDFSKIAGPYYRENHVEDERIFDHICTVLTEDKHLDASTIQVKVESGIVTLLGKVDDRGMKRHAQYLIEHIFGVRDVINSLEFVHQ